MSHDDAAAPHQVAHRGVRRRHPRPPITRRSSEPPRRLRRSAGLARAARLEDAERLRRELGLSRRLAGALRRRRRRLVSSVVRRAGSSRSTHAADTRPSASKTTPSDSSSARFRCTAGAAAPHSPLKPPRRRSDAMTRCQGTRVSAGQFLRITAPTDRAQPPATAATAPYVVTLPRARRARRRAPWTRRRSAFLSRATRRRRNATTALPLHATLLHSTTQCASRLSRDAALTHAACAWV